MWKIEGIYSIDWWRESKNYEIVRCIAEIDNEIYYNKFPEWAPTKSCDSSREYFPLKETAQKYKKQQKETGVSITSTSLSDVW